MPESATPAPPPPVHRPLLPLPASHDQAPSRFRATCESLRRFGEEHPGKFGAILADPPWRFANRTGKVAPEHRGLARYLTLSMSELAGLPVASLARMPSHLYLWCPNALLPNGLDLMRNWGFTYKTNLVWYKVRKDGGPDRRGVGFYFRNVTENVLFGVRGRLRTLAPGRRQPNVIVHRKREHSWKPPTLHRIVSECSPGPFAELFSRGRVEGWEHWGDEVDSYEPPLPVRRGAGRTSVVGAGDRRELRSPQEPGRLA